MEKKDTPLRIIVTVGLFLGVICGTFIFCREYQQHAIKNAVYAIHEETPEVAKRAIRHVWNIERRTSNGTTMLEAASEMGNVELMRYLLEKGANPNGSKKSTSTPLECYCASQFGYRSMEPLEVLIEYGADPSIFRIDSPAYLLAEQFKWMIYTRKKAAAQEVVFLVEHGAPVKSKKTTILHLAAETDEKELMEAILATEEGKRFLWAKDENGKTPWDIAVENEAVKVQEILRGFENE